MKKLLGLFGMCLLLWFCLIISCSKCKAQTAPALYYTFDLANPLQPTVGTGNISPNSGGTLIGGPATGIVSKYFSTPDNTYQQMNCGSVQPVTGATIQFWMRPGYLFSAGRNAQMFRWGQMSCSIEYPNITFTTCNNNGCHDQAITMNGIGRKSWGWIADGNWHHFAFVYKATTGEKQVWIDGQLPAGFTSATSSGNIANGAQLFLNSVVDYVKYRGDIDEIALYLTALDPRQIYQNYVDGKAGNHYSTAFAASVPAAASVTGTLPASDYAPGTNIGSLPVTTGVNVNPVQQLKGFPLPRYKPVNTLLPMYNNGDPIYEGQRFEPGISDAQSVINDTTVQAELCKNYNYMAEIGPYPNAWQTAEGAFANSHLNYKTSSVSLRAQIGTVIMNQANPADKYIQNSSGQFTDGIGNPTSGYKSWRPTTLESFYNADGNAQKSLLQTIINTQTNRPANAKLDYFFENGEEIYTISNRGLSVDPRIADSVNASGLSWQQWYGRRFFRVETVPYRDITFTLTGLTNCRYGYYNNDGDPYGLGSNGLGLPSASDQTVPDRFVWVEARKIATPVNGMYYSTPSMYMIRQDFWNIKNRGVSINGHTQLAQGWKYLQDARTTEIAAGDKLFSPFVAAGWYGDETQNVRPGPWLGWMKVYGVIGAEWMHSSYFTLDGANCKNYAPNWIWQMAIPSYAQAITSRYENILRDGDVLAGDRPSDYTTMATGWQYYAGDARAVVCVRKKTGQNKYIIGGVINKYSNVYDTLTIKKNLMITLAGQQLTFEVRSQGSMYYYDNTTPSTPVFYQLDKWHEDKHPSYYSTTFEFEAEVNDTASSGVTAVTVRPNAAPGNFSVYTTSIRFAGVDSVEYNFQPRSAATHYLYVLAKSVDGTSTGFNQRMDGSGLKTIDCITDTNWLWYRYNTADAAAITYSSLTAANHTLRITSLNSKLAIDRIAISPTNNLYPSVAIPCGAPTATITPSGPTSFCLGGSVTLTANTANSYIWNTGATTQSILVTTSGNYTVTITITGQGTATSAPTTVTVLPLPTAVITPSGSTSFCTGGSVTLTATSNTSYVWSTAATTQSIVVSTTGTFTVTVTGANGCTKVSPSITTTLVAVPTAVITAGGSTNFCAGGSVVLSAQTASGNTYQWKKNTINIAGSTSSTYTATTAGTYTVVVTNSGCSATSNSIVVAPVPQPTTANAGIDQSVCTDSSAFTGNTPVSGTGAWTLVSGSGTITTVGSPNSAVTGLGNGANVFKWTISNAPCTASSDNVTITKTGNSPVSITVTANTNPFCAGATVAYTAIPVNGGTPTFQWKKNGLNVGVNSPSYAAAGVNGDQIQCVLTSSLVCGTGSPATSNTITLSLSSVTAVITAGGPVALCTGGTVSLSANTGSGLTYQWKNSGGNIAGQISSTFTTGTAETYTCVVTNSNGCSATSNAIVVTTGAVPTATITPGGSTIFCTGDSLDLTASGGGTYLWSTGVTTQIIYVKTSGTYTVTVTASGCTASAAVGVAVSALPTAGVTVSGPLSFCIGGSVTLTATANTSYLWSTGETTQGITVDSSGAYWVTVTNAIGCTKTSFTTTVTVNNCSQCTIPGNLTTTDKQRWRVTINWDANHVATDYIVEVVNNRTGKTVASTWQGPTHSLIINWLWPSTSYKWRIQAVCGVTNFTLFSEWQYFKTLNWFNN